MTILRTDTISGIGTEGTVFEGDITVDSLNYMTLPKGTTDQRYSLEGRDPDYHKLKLHLPFVQHTQFDDYSPASPSITANYDSHISSKSGVFENSAALFSRAGANDWIAISDSNDLDLGTDDFTIECWFMCAGGGTDGNLIQKGYNAGTWSYIISFKEATDSINFYATSDGTNFDIVNGTSFGTTILPNRWYHVAVCRSGNTFSYYIDGKKGSTEDTSSASLYNSSIEMRIKEPSGFGSTEDVFFQDVRLYKGVAKYSETFTPQKLAEVGATRYNTDSNKIECYDGTKWMNIAVSSPDLGKSTNSDNHGGARGFVMGGSYSSPGPGTHNEIRYITIPTAGNTTDFGNLTHTTRDGGSCASRTRGLYRFGTGPGDINDNVDYITMSSTGHAGDFGDMGYNARGTEGLSNATRGIFVGGDNDGSPRTYYNTIEYVTIASTGAGKDFGERVAGTGSRPAGGASPTRGIMVGTNTSPYLQIDFITIASTGNASDFGDGVRVTTSSSAACSATRMVYGGATGPGEIDYLTIATTGNSVAFGDMTVDRSSFAAASDCIRGVFMGGDGSPAQFDEIDYITIATEGNAVDFGDLPYPNQQCTGCSNGHGGL